MKTFTAVVASSETYGLGEGPLWDAPRNRVLWVDVNAGRVQIGELATGRVTVRQTLSFPGTVGAVVCSGPGELLVAGGRRLYTVAVDGTVAEGPALIPAATASRFNDGGCDPAGRFLVGSLALDERTEREVLLRVEPSGAVTTLDDDLGLSNGLAFTADGRALYSIDTTSATVWVRSYDATSGACGPRRPFLRLADGSPDGMCLDSHGNLWIAIWGAGQVRCYSPEGDQLAVVVVAAPNTTSVAFVGPDLDTLLITTASEQLAAEALASYPDSGRLFLCDVGVTGQRVPSWAGT